MAQPVTEKRILVTVLDLTTGKCDKTAQMSVMPGWCGKIPLMG